MVCPEQILRQFTVISEAHFRPHMLLHWHLGLTREFPLNVRIDVLRAEHQTSKVASVNSMLGIRRNRVFLSGVFAKEELMYFAMPAIS